MSRKHTKKIRLLSLVAALEVTAIVGLIAWAVAFRADQPSSTQTSTSQQKAAEPTNKPITLKTVPVVEGLTAPTVIATTPDSKDKRLFVGEQAGVIRVVNAQGQLEAKPFLDISSKVKNEGEMGLLGIDFHPKYAQNGYLYVYYINKQMQSILARFQLDKATGLANPNSEKVLLTLQQPYSNHNGGQVAFGPDGYLYFGLGDGGSAGDPSDYGQSKATWFGKILRLDVDHGDPYSVPASNPFTKEAGAKPEIWAWGLRNPWRFSFDRTTHDLYIADVGQGLYEEIDLQKANSKGGENYGWRCYEGLHEFNTTGCQKAETYTKPIIEYDHSNGRCSITGGYVYRGTRWPTLVGKYFYGDYCSGEVFYAQEVAGAWKATVAATDDGKITTFGQDSAGELYLTDHKGRLLRLEPKTP